MDVTLRALVRFFERTRIALRGERAGVDVERWRGAALDIELLKALHVAVVGDADVVRRVLSDGSSLLAAAQPGHVRTKPQALRIGDHVEPAWEPGRLKSGLVGLCRDAASRIERDPVGAAASLVWGLSRAQPFTGLNERLALVLANWVMRGAGLPALNVEQVERDRNFAEALVGADSGLLERFIVDELWAEAVRLVEDLRVTAPTPGRRWTLADEHAAANAARDRAMKLSGDDLVAFVDHVSSVIEREPCGLSLAAGRHETHDTHAARHSAAWQAGIRGRFMCPHEPILVARWNIESVRALDLVLVVGSAGRGTTGAASAHIAIDVAGEPVKGTAPAMLLVVDEDRDERHVRATAWVERALPRAIEQCPIRI